MEIKKPFNLLKWIDEHRDEFKPPVMNKQFFKDADDVIVFVSVGPNTRNDYHVNPTEELFFQLKGDIVIRIRPLDGTPPQDVQLREGEMWLCPRNVPHRPQRPDNTIGLIVEFPRPVGQLDQLRWYCQADSHLVYQADFQLKHIDRDLHRIMDEFWNGPVQRRTCISCGSIVERAAKFELATAGEK